MRPTSLPAALAALAVAAACVESKPAATPAAPEPPEPAPAQDPPAAPCPSYASSAAPVAHVLDGELDEISGLAVSRTDPDVLWAIEDSGNAASVYAMDRTGRLLGEVELSGVFNLDFEDLAAGPCADGSDCLYVADTGDNAEMRPFVNLLRLPEPAPRDGSVEPEEFRFRYPEGPQDAEALAVTSDGTPLVLTKRRDGTSRLYRISLVAGETTEAELVATVDVLDQKDGLFSAVTAADLSDDGSALFVRTYGSGFAFRLPSTGLAGIAKARREVLGLASELQGESLAFDPRGGGLLHVSEGESTPIYALRCAR